MVEFKKLTHLKSKEIEQAYNQMIDDANRYYYFGSTDTQNVVLNRINRLVNEFTNYYNEELNKKHLAKHLQIGDEFYVINALEVHTKKVFAIALEPDNTIIYNWKYREDRIYTNLDDVIISLQEQSTAMIEKLKKDLKGGE